MLKTVSKIINIGILIATLHFALCTLHLSNAYADGLKLKLSPSNLQIRAQAPVEISAPIIIENQEDSAVNLITQFKLFMANDKENGHVKYLTDNDNHSDIFGKIEIIDDGNSVNGLRLAPGQKKHLTLKIHIPKGDPAQDYYFSVIFLSNNAQPQPTTQPNTLIADSTINGGIAMNVLLSIGPKSQPLGQIEEFSSPPIVEKGPIPFKVKVQNKGSKYINPKGTIYIRNMFGQVIGRLDIPTQNVLSNSTRYLAGSSQSSSDPEIKSLNTDSSVIWRENFLLGFYTAQLNLSLSDDSPPLTRTLRFTAFPLGLIIFVLLGFITILIIFKRVKSKMT